MIMYYNNNIVPTNFVGLNLSKDGQAQTRYNLSSATVVSVMF